MGAFMFYVSRLITAPVPLGIFYDAFVLVTFAAVFLNTRQQKEWSSFKNAITLFFILITAYQLLQLFNPNAVSIKGWMVSMRNNTSFLLYIIFLQVFIAVDRIKRLTVIWFTVAFVIALYGIYQEFFGLTDFEWRWIYQVPGRFELYFIWGSLRKFSFLSDPATFGMFMAFSALGLISLTLGPYKWFYKVVFVGASFAMLMSMLYSGTRTATAMVAIGIVFLILLNINNVKVILTAMVLVVVCGVLFFGPFYGGTINRIRSTFNPSEDASMAVRDYKRLRFQNYIRNHPIGGGLFTTGANGLIYSPGHELAEGWDADSGYLLTGLELGWIGLIIFISFFGWVIIKGVENQFSLKDPLLRNLNLVYIVPFFALSIGHFTQHAMFQKPVNLIIIATFALVVRLPQFDQKNTTKLY
jgi:hypothetical protein